MYFDALIVVSRQVISKQIIRHLEKKIFKVACGWKMISDCWVDLNLVIWCFVQSYAFWTVLYLGFYLPRTTKSCISILAKVEAEVHILKDNRSPRAWIWSELIRMCKQQTVWVNDVHLEEAPMLDLADVKISATLAKTKKQMLYFNSSSKVAKQNGKGVNARKTWLDQKVIFVLQALKCSCHWRKMRAYFDHLIQKL